MGSNLALEKARSLPLPQGEYIQSNLEFRTLSLKKYLIQTYFGCTPLWGRGRLRAFSSAKLKPIDPALQHWQSQSAS
jgi:hypothetical protein